MQNKKDNSSGSDNIGFGMLGVDIAVKKSARAEKVAGGMRIKKRSPNLKK